MNTTELTQIMQRWTTVQQELIPQLGLEVGALTPKLEKLIHLIEWVRIEEFVDVSWNGIGRPPHDRGALATAFVAKAVLGLATTAALIERLQMDRALRRICGFSLWKRLPAESSFSRAFAEFAEGKLAERVHEIFIKTQLGSALIGHISRDGTAIEAREKPLKLAKPESKKPFKRGRPRQGESRETKQNVIQQQMEQPLAEIVAALPKACSRGVKCNAQGYKNSWTGYTLHLDTADCGVPIAALLSSASMHDSLAAIPLSLISAGRVTNLYDLMDAAYCSADLREHSKSLGHVPLIDHNPRRGEKIEFSPAEAIRYNERSAAERSNARLKDEFGGQTIPVKGDTKVMAHLRGCENIPSSPPASMARPV